MLKLKDRYAGRALAGYALAVDLDAEGDSEYYFEVSELARRSGLNHPLCKRPD